MYIITKDGSGDFTSIQAAIDAMPADSAAPVILLVRMEEYHEQVLVDKDNIRLIGEAARRTVINGGCGCALKVTANNVEVENLTLRSEGGPALWAAGEHTTWRNVQVQGAVVQEGGAQFAEGCTYQAEPLRAETPAPRKPTWFLCGDSTMCDYTPQEAPRTGWGQALKELVQEAWVENCAMSGRSSKSFVAEKRLGFVELCLRKGDKLLIQFGHNDEKPDVERATVARVTYPEYLNMYVDAARRQGAEPVLLTSIARRHFDENGQLKHTHGDYPPAMRELAAYRGVRLLDMERATEALVQSLGDEGSKALYNWQEVGHPNYPEGVQDNTHLCYTGAVRMAQIALELMEKSEK